ncbi:MULTISPECIES: hypothetical protein [unclassified Mesorhizobium]|uniref:hypothetical protein n=1 Tax=unclassified Mesorhizobium TaxID=325217 RepID=UPI000FCA7CA4|nr:MULTISPECIES: hypothetical protein [unclassified Mesorhizobium]RUX94089.1 hypothetical protein EN993_17040 [Mesorhizobium sp. M7D.F.Ca.US.004.01.2.1]RVA24507.1 hypothetical protein EN935_25965 [Mesorhizobium sp. M7D.F.Ca.US.004.03.1.1]
MDNGKIKEREDIRRSMWVSATIVASLGAFAFMLMWNASPSTGELFSKWLSLDTSLGACAVSFTRLFLMTTIISVGLGVISAGMILSDAIDVFTYKRRFRAYRALFLTGAGLTAFLLLPLVSGDGVWNAGGRHGLSRIDFANACIASHHTTFHRLHWHLLMVALVGWFNIMVLMGLQRAIADGRDPSQLSDDPRTREIQLRTLEWAQRRRASGRIAVKVAMTALAAALFYAGAWSMKPAVLRFIHTFTWERQKANVVETGMQCVLEVKVRRDWVERSRADCSSDAARAAPALAPGEGAWRITKIPTARLIYRAPGGGEYSFDVAGDYYVKMSTSVGTEIEVLRNPASPEGIDKVFDGGDVKRMFYKLLAIIAGAVAIYYLWIRRPRSPRPI